MIKRKKRMSKRKKKIIIIISIILVLGVGLFLYLFFNKDDAPIKKKIKKEKEIIEVKKLRIVDEDSKTRPYAVMINNHRQARINHSGLQDAYIVYEAIVEGGLTRMMALFKDKTTERIGSVRSSRPYYLDYALENDAIYVHFGGSEQALSDIRKLGVNNINGMYDSSAFWRDRTLGVALEHTAFTNIEKINETIKAKGYRMETNKELLLNYKVDEINLNNLENAMVANNVVIPYSGYITTSYTYDPNTKLYNRFVNSTAHVDAITKAQYTTKNIIIVRVSNYNLDSYGRQALNNIGTGEGYYITNGYAIPITWQKNSRAEQTVYRYQNGDEIEVNDGNTYIQIQPLNQNSVIN